MYKEFIVHYWNHDIRINDCFTNHIKWEGKARSIKEAIKKAKQINNNYIFRLMGASFIDENLNCFYLDKKEIDILEKYSRLY